jgi:SAM-dependent methyltransferase
MTEVRKNVGWRFFNDHVESCDVVRGSTLDTLGTDDRRVAEWFIASLAGSHRVLDAGCGAGFPGIYVAPHVGELVGLDAAQNMVRAAQGHAADIGVPNALFQVGNTDALEFADAAFDAVMACGLLESMDWPGVSRTMAELRRVTQPGGRLAVLDQDWGYALQRKARRQGEVRFVDGRPVLRFVERTESPGLERDERHVVEPGSATGRRLLGELAGRTVTTTPLTPSDLVTCDVLDSFYDESAQFSAVTLAGTVSSAGFRDVHVGTLAAWGQVLVLLATRCENREKGR